MVAGFQHPLHQPRLLKATRYIREDTQLRVWVILRNQQKAQHVTRFPVRRVKIYSLR